MADPTIAERVKDTCGVLYTDLDLTDENALEDLIQFYVTNNLEWINSKTGNTYTESSLPGGLQGVLIDIVKRILVNDSIRQDVATITTDDYERHDITEKVINDDILNRLEPYISDPILTSTYIDV